MTNDEIVVVTHDGPIAYLTLNRPKVLNAFNAELRTSLAARLREADSKDDVRVIVVQGVGRAFCSGQDQKESAAFDHTGAVERIDEYGRLFEAFRQTQKPVIAKLRGYAVGAGFQVASLADIRIASRDLQTGLTEMKVGAPCITGSGLLWPLVGGAVVRELVMKGELISAEEAFRLGLVSEVVESEVLDQRVDELAAVLASHAPTAVRLTKNWWRELTEEQFQATMGAAKAAHSESFRSGERTAGAAAFLARSK